LSEEGPEVLSAAEHRGLLIARIGLLSGFSLMLLLSALWLVYIILLIFTRGDPEPIKNIFNPIQILALSVDLVAGGCLAVGFWWFGTHHDTIRNQAQNMAMAVGIWTLVTAIWRVRLLWTPSEEINPVSKRWTSGEFDMFMPHFEFIRDNYAGFLISAILMFFLMTMLVRLIKNYRVYENFQSVNLNLFRVYGLFYLIGAILMGLGWLAFTPDSSATTLGTIFLVLFIVGWLTLFLILPILGLWVFYPSFNIHRSAVETLKFILRRKAEREMLEQTHDGDVHHSVSRGS
jgi:hypothetical protein